MERSHKTQTEALREELNSSSEEKYSSLNTRYDESVKALDAARQAHKDEVEKVRDLEERVEKLKVDVAEAHTKFAELEKSLTSIQLERGQLQQKLEMQETRETEEGVLLSKIEELEHEADAAKEERERLLLERDELQKALSEQKNELQKQVEEFSATGVTAQAQLDAANIAIEKAKKSLDEEHKLTTSLREEIETLKQALTADKKGAEEQMSKMEEVLEEATAQNARLQQQVTEQKTSIEDLHQRLAASRKQQDDAQGEMAEELQQMSKIFSAQLEEIETKLKLKEMELEHVKKEGELAQNVHMAEIAEKEVEVKGLKEALKEVRRQTAHTATVHPENEHDRDGGPGDPSIENEGNEWIEERGGDAGKEADRVNGIVGHPLHNS